MITIAFTSAYKKSRGFVKVQEGRSGYYPNSLSGGCPMLAPESAHGYVHYQEKVEGHKVRARSESFRDYFSQATLFWNSLTPAEQAHLIAAGQFELGKVETKEVRERMVALLDFLMDVARRFMTMPSYIKASNYCSTSAQVFLT
jgi:catalase